MDGPEEKEPRANYLTDVQVPCGLRGVLKGGERPASDLGEGRVRPAGSGRRREAFLEAISASIEGAVIVAVLFDVDRKTGAVRYRFLLAAEYGDVR